MCKKGKASSKQCYVENKIKSFYKYSKMPQKLLERQTALNAK